MLTLCAVRRLAGVTVDEVQLAITSGALQWAGVDAVGEPLFALADVRAWIVCGRPLDDLDQIC